jgi:hypothetical protein
MAIATRARLNPFFRTFGPFSGEQFSQSFLSCFRRYLVVHAARFGCDFPISIFVSFFRFQLLACKTFIPLVSE